MHVRSLFVALFLGCVPDEPPYPAAAIDDDGDGFSEQDGDCDDQDAAAFPGQAWFEDADGDGYGSEPATGCGAPSAGFSSVGGDCAPADAARYESGTWFEDADGDGFGAGDAELCGPIPGRVGVGGDCAPSDPALFEAGTWFVDGDGDGYGASDPIVCGPIPDAATSGGDCADADPFTHPNAPEDCAPIDRDCDGGAVPDPICRLSGLMQADAWGVGYPYGGATTPPQLDGDLRADVMLFGTYVYGPADWVEATYIPLDDLGEPGTATPVSATLLFGSGGAYFRWTADLDGDLEPNLFLVTGGYGDPGSLIWEISDDSGAPGQLSYDDGDAWLFRTNAGAPQHPYPTVGSFLVAADFSMEPGNELALGASTDNGGTVEVWGGFADPEQRLLSTLTAPTYYGLGMDVATTDLNGDGLADIVASGVFDDFFAEPESCLWLFHGPFDDAVVPFGDALLCTPGAVSGTVPQVDIAEDFEGDGVPWVWFGTPAGAGGSVWAVAGTALTASQQTVDSVLHRRIDGGDVRPEFGASLGSAGDQTGDAIPDLLVGNPHAADSDVWLIDTHAVAFSSAATLLVDDVDQAQFQSGGAQLGFNGVSAGDIDGDGFEDIWIGEVGFGATTWLLTGGVQ